MKPAPFTYHRPRSLAEAFAVLSTHADDAKVIAGGQSLGPMMNMRLAQPGHLVDLNDLGELARIRDDGDAIAIGALARQHDVEVSELVRCACPLLAQAAATIGHYAIRQRGTIGGSLAHADPAAQLPLVAVTLGAQIEIAGPRGRRTLAAADFFLSMMTTALEPDELIVDIRFPKRFPREGAAFEPFSRRCGDFAIVAVAATVCVDRSGRSETMRIGIGGVDAVPIAMQDVAQRFRGRAATAEWCAQVAAAVQDRVDPAEDSRIPARFRKELAGVLTRRALIRAVAVARGD